MIAIDTNILIRIFAEDDPAQNRAAVSLLAQYGKAGVLVTPLVLAEFVWVMRRRMKTPVSVIVGILDRIINAPEFIVNNQPQIEEALEIYRTGRCDFSDCLIVIAARDAGATDVFTFDRRAAESIPGATLLSN
jgi:predicted nucleic-acid-binding protein